MTKGPDFYAHEPGESDARRLAMDILNSLAFRAQETAAIHAHLSDVFWHSVPSPDDIIKEMGPLAKVWIETARAHGQHIAAVAKSMNVDFSGTIKEEHVNPPRKATINADGTATLDKLR